MTSLIAENVSMVFDGHHGTRTVALDEVGLRLASSDPGIVSLVGASGSGKSTLGRVLLGLTKPTSGTVRFNGVPLGNLSRAQKLLFRQRVQPVFQDPYAVLNPFYPVDRPLKLAARRLKLCPPDEIVGRVAKSLEAVRLDPAQVLGRYPHQLSGGQRQRLMLARIHLIGPDILIADEAVSMLDAQIRRSFLDLLLSLHEERDMTTLFITHDLSTVSYLGGQMHTMLAGRIVESGAAAALLSTPSHPYTRLLLESVPIADPDRRWTDRIDLGVALRFDPVVRPIEVGLLPRNE